MTRSTGTSGFTCSGEAPSVVMPVAHGGEVNHRGDAGQVQHQDSRGLERDLALGAPLLGPVRDPARVVDGIAGAVFATEHVFAEDLRVTGNRAASAPIVLAASGSEK
jgi:hypothetical protein